MSPNIIKVEISIIKSYLYQIVSAIKYMNENSMMHRDLKPQNILINDKGKIKICDFG
jgi:serine/threonine protein kinase